MSNYSTAEKDSFRQTIHDLLLGCHVSPRRAPFDNDLHRLCLDKCQQDGVLFDVEGEITVKEYLVPGVIMISTAYAHIPRHLQVIVAVYAAFTLWIDDTFAAKPEPLAVFGVRFVKGEEQGDKGLDAWVKVIKELMEIYPAAQSNLICTASLNFVTAMLVEDGLQKQPAVNMHSRTFAAYLRDLSSACEAFGVFVFPPDVPLLSYIRVLPDVKSSFGFFNDILSFYKEESAEEDSNYISNEAHSSGEPKLVVLSRVAERLVGDVARIESLLDGCAKDAFQSFKEGFVSFHFTLEKRYRLGELLSI